MEVHVRNVPEQATEKALRALIKESFKRLRISIDNVNCHKNRGKTNATLTFLLGRDGEFFLRFHGSTRPAPRARSTPSTSESRNLMFMGRPIYCEISNRPANPYLLRVLRTEAEKRKAAQVARIEKAEGPDVFPISFRCVSLSCGAWAYEDSNAVFSPQLQMIVPGTVQFWQHIMVLTLSNGLRLEFRYSATWSITVDDEFRPCFFFHMREPPHIFEEIRDDPIIDLILQLRISGNQRPPVRRGPTRHRLPCLNEVHSDIAGSCLVYRIGLETAPVPGQYGDFMQRLRKARAMPTLHHHEILLCRPLELYVDGFKRLKQQLIDCTHILPFTISFQVQKLAQDGYLPPGTVVSLLNHIIRMKLRSGERICVGALRRLFTRIPYAGPDTESEDLSVDNIVALLKESEDFCTRQAATKATKSSNVAVIHRAKITPSSIHLYGPEPESNNRVLRKYPNNHDSFLRVQFFDEDGGPLNFDPKVSLEKIYQGRFKDILHKGIQIAGRDFRFLGFSHSSLRSHSCWFVASFMHKGYPWGDREIIGDLGDFSMIRSPAKCAARIGQAFSDTRTAISIPFDFLKEKPDVEREGRVFSDGVGTMSPAVMDLICENLPKQFGDLLPKPTCLQIRFQGAKGMISLDCRLRGNVLNLRPSMVKFLGSNSWDVEICEAAYKPLPAFLNRQFIKILEDMGVPYPSFLKLQTKEVRHLKTMTNNPWDVSKFFHRQSIGQSMNLARFVQELAHRNIDFRQDPFLRNVLEAALLVELRLLKHKTRIPVSEGQVLYGIMDETDYLKEGQVFCTYNDENGQAQILVQKSVLVSRAPALHSGDVQLVEAVKPPRTSPLRKLSNCICFSQKGARDLPSKLSGGDLDGDLYLVIWDKTLLPTQFFLPADYPRVPPVDIGRSVTRADMTDFFIQFMETDQLGRIATKHVQLADRGPLGTREADCITLAEMHSTAVDFSKTGIPVDMSQLPQSDNWRPDFMAPGPHVNVETNMGVVFDEEVYMDPQENWDENEDNKGYRYYESNKILGKLYRAIDEREVLKQIQDRETAGGITANSVVVEAVWKYVKEKCRNFQWEHLKEKAGEIRDMYEECVLGIMTEYSDHPTRPLSELEAFVGNIIGKTGALGRHQRDAVKTLKEKIKEDTTYIIDCILKDGDESSEEALEQSIACLAVSMEERPAPKRAEQPIYSFKYIAAAVAMREAEKLPGFEVLPPLDIPMWLTYGDL